MPFNLKVADITPTYLYTNYADKNLISKIEFIRNGEDAYNDAATTAIQSEVSAFDRMTDGKIYDASGTDPYNSSLGWYGQSSSQLGEFYYKGDKLHLDRVAEEGDNFDAKFIMTLKGETTIDSFYFFGHLRANLTTTTYKVFAGNDKDTLFDAANEVALFDYAKYTDDSVAKLNGNNYSEGQIWSFGDKKPQGKYVGLIVYDAATNASNPKFLEVAELGVCGETLNKATADTNAAEITSNYVSTVKATNITPELFTENLVNKNILKSGSFTVYNNEFKAIANPSIAPITDGVIDTAGGYTDNSYWYSYNGLTGGAVPEGYITFTLDDIYELNQLSIITSPRANTAMAHYEVYAATSEENLYNSDNLVSSFKYDGYPSDSNTAGKLNTANGSQNSEGQIYTFTGDKKPYAKYVGIKVFDGSANFPGWVYLSEVNIQGLDTNANLDLSELNDETLFLPVTEKAEEGKPYSFKIDTKNGATVTKVTVDGTELTAVDGVYTIESLVNNSKVVVKTDRDEFATKDGIWNGLNLNLGSASYGKNIWDGDYVVHETAMFYNGHTEVQLLYPIENIISIRSYDFKETYWIGEDFEIVDGKLKLTENSRIAPYENAEDLKNLKLNEEGKEVTDFSSVGAWESKQWKYQVRVTYTHSATWDGTTYNVAPEGKLNDIAKFHKKAISGEDTTVLFLGDSISVGCNASGLYQETLAYSNGADASTLNNKIQSYYAKYGLSSVPDWGSASKLPKHSKINTTTTTLRW